MVFQRGRARREPDALRGIGRPKGRTPISGLKGPAVRAASWPLDDSNLVLAEGIEPSFPA